MLRNLILLLSGIAICSSSLPGYGQSAPSMGWSTPVVNKPTEEAAALTRYGTVPVNCFTGQPNIGVPLHTVNYEQISVPIALNYDASGVRVDQHPSWVGLNFNLTTGGIITRSVKGMPDDYMFPDESQGHFANTEKGYLFCGDKLNNSNWNSINSLINFAYYRNPDNFWNPEYLADGIPDDYHFQFGNFSGNFFIDEQGVWRVQSQTNLGLEITHETNSTPLVWETNPRNGFQVLINKQITKFIITTPDGTQYTFGGDVASIDYSRGIADNFNMFYEAGVRMNLSPSAWHLTQIKSPDGAVVMFSYERGQNLIRYHRSLERTISWTPTSSDSAAGVVDLSAVILTPCYLTSITTPTDLVTFHRSFSKQQIFEGIPWKPVQGLTLIDFDKQLWKDDYNTSWGNARGWRDFHFDRHRDVWPLFSSIGMDDRCPDFSPKLDSICVTSRMQPLPHKVIRFGYNNVATERLFLESVQIAGGTAAPESYAFNYYSRDQVPPYISLQKDQWGYYNGVDYTTSPNIYSSTLWRLPSLTHCIAGTLKEIVYPTGGSATFEFELNNYAQFQKVTMTHIAGGVGDVSLETTANTNAGGLRIKKITFTGGYNSMPFTKTYFYNRNYAAGGTLSSGILSGRNQYIKQGKYASFCNFTNRYIVQLSDNQLDPFGDDVQFVTYSEVTEVNGDGGKTTYKYSNYDASGALDEMNLTPYFHNVMESDLYQLSSGSLERGLLLQEDHYNAANFKVFDKVYEYDYATDRKTNYARCIQRYDLLKQEVLPNMFGKNEFCHSTSTFRLYPFKKYYYQVPLKKITGHTYTSGAATVTTSESFTYDSYGNRITTTSENSDNQLVQQITKFNSDPAYLAGVATSTEATGLRKLFTDYKIKNYPVEQLTIQKAAGNQLATEQITGGTLYQYRFDQPVVSKVWALELDQPFYPVTLGSNQSPVYHFTNSAISGGGFVSDSRYRLQSTVNAYTSAPPGAAPKPIDITTLAGKASYTWDYRLQHMSSRTVGATADEIAFSSFEGIYLASGIIDNNRGYWDFDKNKIVYGGFSGTRAIGLGSGDFVRSDASLASGKLYTVSFWVKGSTNPRIKLGSTLLSQSYASQKTAGAWRYYSITVTGNGGQVSVVPETGALSDMIVDELRLYPQSARMQSYTYDPATGNVTTVSDESGTTVFYSYDGLGRLEAVRNEAGHILKKHSYQLFNQN